ncbi:MAG: RadC family protein [Desulfosudaceae bacterium]
MRATPAHKGTGHRQRLREKFLKAGLDGFHDYEIIELLLTIGTPVKDCKEPAKAALREFQSLQGVLEASSEDLCRVRGIGPTNVFGLKLIKAVADRYLEKKIIDRPLISNSRELLDYLNHTIRDKGREVFLGIFLDAKNRVLAVETLSRGTLTQSSVYPREVVRRALAKQAAAVIFCHNHPSGEPDPSAEDTALTRRLLNACRLMGITVHEHIIIAARGHYSFADNGFIARLNREFEAGEQM